MGGMKMVFRLRGIGFSLPVEDLIEIRESDCGPLDRSAAQPENQILGALAHRGGSIPLRDLHRRLGLPLPADGEELPVLVLVGAAGPWGGRVEEVCGIFSAAEFLVRPVPPMLSRPRHQPFDRLDIWRDEPLISCAAEQLESGWGRAW